jgi:O-glycosyl hydrolase
MTFHYLPLNNSNYTVNSSAVTSGSVVGKLAKITAVKDTIKVTATNYQAKSVTISSYDTTVNITLDSEGVVVVHLDQTHQTIMGFGINNNWSPIDESANTSLFDSVNGLGLSILRIGMGTDGNLTSGNSWSEVTNAVAKGCKYIIGSTWSPPADYKTNGSVNDGGYLKTANYDAWATTIAAFATKCKNSSGTALYAMSLGNEPDFKSCGYTEPCNGNYSTTLWNDTQMVKFIKIAGPKIRAVNGCKVMAPEASEWLHLWSDSSGCCSVPSGKMSSNPLDGKGYDYGHALYKDTAAWNQIDILGVHQYDTQVAEPWPSDVNNGVPNKEIWQTEMSGVKWWPEQGTLTQKSSANGGYDVAGTTDISNGVAVAAWVHNGLTVGNASAWCYWWWKPISNSNEGLILYSGTDTKRHYTFGNFSKYVRPGMVRVDLAGNIPDSVLISAYKGNSTVVIVAINKGSSSKTVPISISGGTVPSTFTQIVTSASANWASSAASMTGGVLTATLAATSVTTFVGK